MNNSVVESVFSSELRISIEQDDFLSLIAQVVLRPFTSSGFELGMGADGTAITLTDYGLSDGDTFSCIDECCADLEANRCAICGEPATLIAAYFVFCRLRCVRPDIYGKRSDVQVAVLNVCRVCVHPRAVPRTPSTMGVWTHAFH